MLSVPRPRPPVSDDRSVSPPSGMPWSLRVRRRVSNFLRCTLSDGAEVELGDKTSRQTRVVRLTEAWIDDGLRLRSERSGNRELGSGPEKRVRSRSHGEKKEENKHHGMAILCDIEPVSTHQRTRIFLCVFAPWNDAPMFLRSLPHWFGRPGYKSECVTLMNWPCPDIYENCRTLWVLQSRDSSQSIITSLLWKY